MVRIRKSSSLSRTPPGPGRALHVRCPSDKKRPHVLSRKSYLQAWEAWSLQPRPTTTSLSTRVQNDTQETELNPHSRHRQNKIQEPELLPKRGYFPRDAVPGRPGAKSFRPRHTSGAAQAGDTTTTPPSPCLLISWGLISHVRWTQEEHDLQCPRPAMTPSPQSLQRQGPNRGSWAHAASQ